MISDDKKIIGGLYNSVRYLIKLYVGLLVEFKNIFILCGLFREDMNKGLIMMRLVYQKMGIEFEKQKVKGKASLIDVIVEKFKKYVQ